MLQPSHALFIIAAGESCEGIPKLCCVVIQQWKWRHESYLSLLLFVQFVWTKCVFILTGGHFVNQIKQAKRSFEKMMNKRENIDHRNNEESEEEQYSISY